MCGRFAITDPARVREEFGLAAEVTFAPRYNIAPSQAIPIIRSEEGAPVLFMARWGLIPSWAKDEKISYKTINARAETLAEKPAYRSAYRKRRCLIPADGFYEWQKTTAKTKQPYFIHLKSRGVLALAGLWEEWQGPEGTVLSATIVTTAANRQLAGLHDRMPLIVPPERRAAWLDVGTDPVHDPDFLGGIDPDGIEIYPVGSFVNNAGHDGPECLEPLEIEPR